MGRKSRQSAKTGDQNLYKSRSSKASSRRDDNSDDDAMYNEVERHYNRHIDTNDDYLRLDDDGDSSEEDDGVTTKREGVFDLGIASDQDDDDGESSESASSDGDQRPQDLENDLHDDSSDGESEEKPETNVFNWGTKKHSYYHGDTADLEIGQDEDDALLEEEAGKEVQLARLEDMEEEDFMLDADSNVEEVKGKKKRKGKRSDTTVLSRKDKMKLMKSAHPELMPVVDHFRGDLEDFVESTAVVGGALFRADGGNESEVCSLCQCLMSLSVHVTDEDGQIANQCNLDYRHLI
jgi:U3 small nucleolar RNA-associated protein 3